MPSEFSRVSVLFTPLADLATFADAECCAESVLVPEGFVLRHSTITTGLPCERASWLRRNAEIGERIGGYAWWVPGTTEAIKVLTIRPTHQSSERLRWATFLHS